MKSRIFWKTAALITIGAATMLPVVASADDGDEPAPPPPPPAPSVEMLYPQYGQFINLVDRTDNTVLSRVYNGNFPMMEQPSDNGE